MTSAVRRVLRTAALVLPVVGLAALPACRREDRPGRADWRVMQLYVGGTGVRTIAEPENVTAYRISPDATPPRVGVPHVGLHRITSAAVTVPPEDVALLSRVLLSADTYDWHRAKSCEFRPGVGLRFERAATLMDLALCFECDMLTIHRDGRRIGVEDFDAARPELVRLAKRLFPGDADIAALPESE